MKRKDCWRECSMQLSNRQTASGLARKIRGTVGDDAPIIILTVYDWSDIEQEAKEAGVTAFCAKPLFMSDLKSALFATNNGYEATRAIRNLSRKDVKDLPIIAMTANAMEEDKEAALASGMNAHLSKPVDIEALIDVLGQFLK